MDGPRNLPGDWFLVIWLSAVAGFTPLGIIGTAGGGGGGCGCLALESGLANEILLESGGTDCILQECAPVDPECLLLETGSPNEILLELGGTSCAQNETGAIPPAGPLISEAGGGDDLLDEAGGDIDNEA